MLIYVEKGENDTGSIVVPDVSGRTYEQAVILLSDAGLDVLISGDETGIAVRTEPKYGLTVEKGTEVTVYFEKQEEETEELPQE